MRAHGPAVFVLLAVAFAVRWWLRQGRVLGDDPQEPRSCTSCRTARCDDAHLRFAGGSNWPRSGRREVSVAAMCDCASAENHGKYVKCAGKVVKGLVADGSLILQWLDGSCS
jgi:hypothetical protein